MSELNGEIGRLTTAIDKNSKEQQSMASLENKVKEMALEILELQGQAADLNLLQEKISTSSDPSQMEGELKSLTNDNERESHQVERIFEDVKSVKEKVAALEKAIQIVS
jgi:predicted  nucleic acid-binding Zn-ribbon protein